MTNKKVQEKLCTEPKEPEQAMEFAIGFRGRDKKAEKLRNTNYQFFKTSVKSEPVFAVKITN